MEFVTVLREKEFSSTIPEVVIELSEGEEQIQVVVSVDNEELLNEQLYGVGGFVTLQDLTELVTPYARKQMVTTLSITATETNGTTITTECDVVYCDCDMGEGDPVAFLNTHFLSILIGEKITARGRREYLHMHGEDDAVCTAHYTDGTVGTYPVEVAGTFRGGKTFDVSPDNFQAEGKELITFTITAGNRSQSYSMDLLKPDCAPIFIFVNSFGLDEWAYCTGIHRVAPAYSRSAAYVGRLQKNYRIDETRNFKADTGPLNIAMANWWDEVFRSQSVRIVNFYDGHPNIGKDVIITDSKSEYSNDNAEQPRFTFTYQYAQRNHNVLQLLRAGRIFDNTFDNTFN